MKWNWWKTSEDLRNIWTRWNNNRRWIDDILLSLNEQDRNGMRKSIEDVGYKQTRIKIDVFLLTLFQIVIIISIIVRTSNLSNLKHFFFTSVKSLLTLFAIALIFYCQAIVVRSMFNSHQVDLSSENSSFIYTSSVLFSFITFAIVRYMMFMFVSRFSKALHFDEYNITNFFKYFEK